MLRPAGRERNVPVTSSPTAATPTRTGRHAAPTEPTAGHRLVVLGLVLTAQLMVVLDTTIVNIALTVIGAALDFSPTGLAWVITAYTLAFGGLLLLGARAGD